MRFRLTTPAILAVLTALLTIPACGPRSRPPRVAPRAGGPGVTADPMRVRTDHGVREIPLEDYVAGCVLAELGSPAADGEAAGRARAVQAILCRSYAVTSRGRHAASGFDVCGTTHCQVYRPVPDTEAGRLAAAAADATRGIVLTFEGRAVRPTYHAHCGGHTSAAADVWPGSEAPWLAALHDTACARGHEWHFTADLQRLGRALAADGRLALRLPLRAVRVERRDAAGRAALVRLQGANSVVVRGDQFRAVLMNAFGASAVRSTLFTISRAGRRLTLHGHGSGHGVGLCQAGALHLAALGRPPEAILQHYFPGTDLARLD